MNKDIHLIFENYKKKAHFRKEMNTPPEFDETKSRLYNRIKRLNHEFTKDFKVDTNKHHTHPDSLLEKYESISHITGATIDQIKMTLDQNIDPAPPHHIPTIDPIRYRDLISVEEDNNTTK